MSYSVSRTSFGNVPYIDHADSFWPHTIEGVDPLVRQPVEVGLSAAQVGMVDIGNQRLLELVTDEPLFADDGSVHPGIMNELDGIRPGPAPMELALAGLGMAAICIQTSRLLRQNPVRSYDYTGQTGVEFVQREATVQVPSSQARSVGRLLNVGPVKLIEAHIESVLSPDSTPDDFEAVALQVAAERYSPDNRQASSTVSLQTNITRLRSTTVSAETSNGARLGNFAAGGKAPFRHLNEYARALAIVLPRLPTSA